MAQHHGVEGIPNLVLIGVPDLAALQRADQKLCDAQIPHFNWREPDGNMGFTAIATAPLVGEQRKCLANYRLWRADSVTRSWPNCKATGSNPVSMSA